MEKKEDDVFVVDLVERIPMGFIFDVLENLVSNCLRNTVLLRTKLGKEGSR